jgi:uncharacterized damage-inducible protein DinB
MFPSCFPSSWFAQGNDEEIEKKQKEAERVLAEARAAAQKEIQDAKSAATAEQEKKLAEVKAVRTQPADVLLLLTN